MKHYFWSGNKHEARRLAETLLDETDVVFLQYRVIDKNAVQVDYERAGS